MTFIRKYPVRVSNNTTHHPKQRNPYEVADNPDSSFKRLLAPECTLTSCFRCGYDLRGIGARTCPECGLHDPSTPLPEWPTLRILPLVYSGTTAILLFALLHQTSMLRPLVRSLVAPNAFFLEAYTLPISVGISVLFSIPIVCSAHNHALYGRRDRIASALFVCLIMSVQWVAFGIVTALALRDY